MPDNAAMRVTMLVKGVLRLFEAALAATAASVAYQRCRDDPLIQLSWGFRRAKMGCGSSERAADLIASR